MQSRVIATDFPTSQLSFSPKGDRIAYADYERYTTHLLTLDGRRRHISLMCSTTPQWLPDGKHFLTCDGEAITLVDADTMIFQNLIRFDTLSSYKEIKEYALSPDGRTIAYTVSDGPGMSEATELHVTRCQADVTIRHLNEFERRRYNHAERLPPSLATIRDLVSVNFLSWSSDSRFLTFSARQPDKTSYLYIFDLRMSQYRRLEIGAYDQVWRPHSDHIAYKEGGAEVIRIIDTNGRQLDSIRLKQNVFSHESSERFLWAPDGMHFAHMVNDLKRHFRQTLIIYSIAKTKLREKTRYQLTVRSRFEGWTPDSRELLIFEHGGYEVGVLRAIRVPN